MTDVAGRILRGTRAPTLKQGLEVIAGSADIIVVAQNVGCRSRRGAGSTCHLDQPQTGFCLVAGARQG